MPGNGASCLLPCVPARVASLNRQRPFSLGSWNCLHAPNRPLLVHGRGVSRPVRVRSSLPLDDDDQQPWPQAVARWRAAYGKAGIHYMIINGQVLMEDGKHTGALPGRVLRNTYYHAHHG